MAITSDFSSFLVLKCIHIYVFSCQPQLRTNQTPSNDLVVAA